MFTSSSTLNRNDNSELKLCLKGPPRLQGTSEPTEGGPVPSLVTRCENYDKTDTLHRVRDVVRRRIHTDPRYVTPSRGYLGPTRTVQISLICTEQIKSFFKRDRVTSPESSETRLHEPTT